MEVPSQGQAFPLESLVDVRDEPGFHVMNGALGIGAWKDNLYGFGYDVAGLLRDKVLRHPESVRRGPCVVAVL